MKRAAIALSGFVRNYDNIENIIKFIIEPNPDYEFDFFLFFYQENIINTSKKFTEMHNFKQDVDGNKVIDKYKPVAYDSISIFELQNKFIENKLENLFIEKERKETIYNTILGQMYMCEQSMNLVDKYSSLNNIKYDLVVRYRFDMFTDTPLIFDNYKLNTINAIYHKGSAIDWLFFSTYENMSEFMKVFTNLLNRQLFPHIIPEYVFKQNAEITCGIEYIVPHTFQLNKTGFELASLDPNIWHNGFTS